MRTHNHAVGESGNFWTLNLSLSNYVNPSYSDLKELWEETLEDSSVKFCGELLMMEVVYSIVSLHKQQKHENKKGVRLANWHIHIIIYCKGCNPRGIALALKDSWIKLANRKADWIKMVREGKQRDNTYKQGCHCYVAVKEGQYDCHCYNRGRIAYMMWQAIHRKFYAWERGKEAKYDFSEMLRRLKLATRETIRKRTAYKKKLVIADWIEWARNVKIALGNIPLKSNPLLVDCLFRLLLDAGHNDNTLKTLGSKIQNFPDIKTAAQWQSVYDKLVKNLHTMGVQGLIEDGYEAIKKELENPKPLLGIHDTTGGVFVLVDGNVKVCPEIPKESL